MFSKKRRRTEPPSIHPRNKYSEKPPDFDLLASLYPSFQPYVFFSSRSGRPAIDWSDFNATRELTRVLLLHDHGVNWWIPDGQLCPTVPNRSNYIHWIEDLLSSELVPSSHGSDGMVRGFDIGTGANCIYPLLGASLLGWTFVGSDVTDVALEWARKNVENNPHLSELIEIRDARDANSSLCYTASNLSSEEFVREDTVELAVADNAESLSQDQNRYKGQPIFTGVVKDGENFDFCMCNPPFFESIEEVGLNPRTSCGGTSEEMVCPGGERAFITHIIKDSVMLKHSFRWFTSMVGRKTNLKFLLSKLHEIGASIVKTTEFVQGKTARWGLAWSFMSPSKKIIACSTPRRNHHSFTLEGLPRQFGAFQVLKSVESFFLTNGASCKPDFSSFSINVTLPNERTDVMPTDYPEKFGEIALRATSSGPNNMQCLSGQQLFCVSVFEQIPGTLLVKGALLHNKNSFSGGLPSLFWQLEEALKKEFQSKSQKR